MAEGFRPPLPRQQGGQERAEKRNGTCQGLLWAPTRTSRGTAPCSEARRGTTEGVSARPTERVGPRSPERVGTCSPEGVGSTGRWRPALLRAERTV